MLSTASYLIFLGILAGVVVSLPDNSGSCTKACFACSYSLDSLAPIEWIYVIFVASLVITEIQEILLEPVECVYLKFFAYFIARYWRSAWNYVDILSVLLHVRLSEINFFYVIRRCHSPCVSLAGIEMT